MVKLFGFEKLPEAAVQVTLVWPWAVPVKLIICPGHVAIGVVPASTVKGWTGATQPLFT